MTHWTCCVENKKAAAIIHSSMRNTKKNFNGSLIKLRSMLRDSFGFLHFGGNVVWSFPCVMAISSDLALSFNFLLASGPCQISALILILRSGRHLGIGSSYFTPRGQNSSIHQVASESLQHKFPLDCLSSLIYFLLFLRLFGLHC